MLFNISRLASLLLPLLAQAAPIPRATNPYRQDAIDAANALKSMYNTNTGQFNNGGGWQTAVSINVLADMSIAIPESASSFSSISPNTYSRAQSQYPGFLDDYFDDDLWWALAWIRVYDLNGNQQYLNTAVSIFNDVVKEGANTTCGGGIWWNRSKNSVNAIANELFLSVAAHLANRVSNKSYYLNWANKQWQWFARSGMINSGNLINDGLTTSCANNGGQIWTYNQGAILGGLVELSRASGDNTYLSYAQAIADAAITRFAGGVSGILKDPGEPNLGNDGPQFKGVFMENLCSLYGATGNGNYATFFKANAASIWAKARSSSNQVGVQWAGPVSGAAPASQNSAVSALLCAAMTG